MYVLTVIFYFLTTIICIWRNTLKYLIFWHILEVSRFKHIYDNYKLNQKIEKRKPLICLLFCLIYLTPFQHLLCHILKFNLSKTAFLVSLVPVSLLRRQLIANSRESNDCDMWRRRCVMFSFQHYRNWSRPMSLELHFFAFVVW